MRFNIGEKVSFLTETGYGIVRSYKNEEWIVVEDETGFEREMPIREIVKIHGDPSHVLMDDFDLADVYDVPVNTGQSAPRGLMKFKDYWEIDLHSHTILDTERGLSNSQILERQLYEVKRCFRDVKKNLVRKFIIIHGVGEGVLKQEVRYFLEGKEGIEFYDADFREYGKGATEVRLYYKQ